MATASPQSKIVIASPLRRSPRQAPTRQSVPPAAAGVASAPGGAIRASTSTTGVVSAPATGAAHTACRPASCTTSPAAVGAAPSSWHRFHSSYPRCPLYCR
ncbi:hypothetical protein E2562_038158 [Oryza meyeriana var. granulata]|uniref:Uncharacterized protein n=1 Tax=Oryza meyeriana var. granulata TaxID=110450 RepID=A0A6G1CKF2_9ORYZ|nr:hypothetical protein E2562_038158 [Oryza meyeriana var. granulata]KAF0901134.1 hypothetical protein E2562_038158 [Oryza meyeriana var. granulata]KAF0901135.1 hypothetical protein E2562_038158 [Oryza meyeriana var. granulata]KAF0901136.1 hypothetical protein E2562_038158 [Oryza meyeriana var. granulata]